MTIRLLGRGSGLMFGVGKFSPTTSIPGLQLWLRADVGGSSDAGVTLAVADATVQQWNDSSGMARHLSQATAGLRPQFKTAVQNGLPGVRFTVAAAGRLFSAAFASALAQPLTLAVVGKNTGDTTDFRSFTDGILTTNKAAMYQDVTTGNLAMHGGTPLVSSTSTANQYLVLTGVFNGATSALYVNGTSAATGNAGTNSLTGLTIGSNFNGGQTYLAGDINEVLLYSGALTAAQITALNRYLGARWAVTVA